LPPNETERRNLEELLAAMRAPCAESFNGRGILNVGFAQEFRAALAIHHYYLRATLGTNFFEAAFKKAANAAGHHVQAAPDGGRFWDIELDGKKISLKSSAASSMRLGKLHISKLCEAAWIQDVRGAAAREEATKRLFAEYTSIVDSIIQLRYFRATQTYEMVQISSNLLRQVAEVPRSEFAPDGPSIGIPVGQVNRDFTLKLDRSDAKITLANINKNVCQVLGLWQLQLPQ
jgi:Type II site-specific deoxyribonuclease